MVSINIITSKKCAICKYWYDPTNSAINPKAPHINVWEYDDKAKRMCLKKGSNTAASATCGMHICKLEKM